MRVIAGQFRSRKLKSVPGLAVRPTPDRLRESLFSILASRLEGSVFVDAYAGSGTVGIEALSRGAGHVIFIEHNAAALEVLRDNLRTLGIEARVEVVKGRAASRLHQHPADIVFLDPPYEHLNEYRNALSTLADTRTPLVIAQHAARTTLEELYGDLRRTRVLRQGDNALSFFERALGPQDASTSQQDVNVHDIRPGGPSANEIAELIEE